MKRVNKQRDGGILFLNIAIRPQFYVYSPSVVGSEKVKKKGGIIMK